MTALEQQRLNSAAKALLEKAAEIVEEDGPESAAAMIRSAIVILEVANGDEEAK